MTDPSSLSTIEQEAPRGGAASRPSPRLGLDPASFDPAVRPQDDLYRYVNGGWLDRTEIPPDKSSYGAFVELADKAEEDLRVLIEELAAAEHEPGTEAQQIGDFYRSFMDTETIEARGLAPLEGELARIDAIATKDDLVRYVAFNQRLGVEAPLALYVNQDARDASRYIAYWHQSGLGMPDRDYYLRDEPRFEEIRRRYAAYLERLAALAGWPDPPRVARTVADLEKRLAEAHWTRVQNRDREATYNKLDAREAARLAPGVDWRILLEGAGIAPDAAFIVRQPSYLAALARAFAELPLDTWKTYFRVRLLDRAAPYLPERFVTAHFDFHERTLSGVEAMRARWKRAVEATNLVLGEAVGKRYVERHFRPEAKRRMDRLVAHLLDAFARAIDELDWMSPQTKAAARDKLAKFTPKIGYPEKWKDYSRLVVRRDDLLGNVLRSAAVEYERAIEKLDRPVDRTEWFMTPQTVNAYYNPTMNEVVFPAAILQPPFFDVEADDAVNFGAIGAVIGHEISHGFDDQGRKSDGDGNLRDWWTDEDARRFDERARRLVEQYERFSPLPGLHVNGELTLGENIADLAGVATAHRAYRLFLGGAAAPVLEGTTGDQRFFMGWAQVWRRKYREDELRRRLLTDPHAPSPYRVNGVVANIDAFHEAFEVRPGDGLYRPPEERVRIW